MKKQIWILLFFVMLVSFFSCQKEAANKKNGTEVNFLPTFRLVTDRTGVSDKSFNAAAWKGVLKFYGDKEGSERRRGEYYDVVTCPTQDAYLSTLKMLSDQGFGLICANGFTFADSIQEVAKLYPDQNYMIADVDWLSADNIMQFTFAEHEGSYLVGLVAALKAKEDGIKNPKFGFIGGVPGSTITRFEMGYIQGIKSIFPDAEILDYYANDWGKPELAKTQAKNWYDSGVYVIFSAAGGTGNGTIAQAKEYRIQGKNIWAIGVDSDQYEDGLYGENESAVLTSMIKRVESATLYALEAVKNKKFSNSKITLDLAHDGLAFSMRNNALSENLVKQVNAVKDDIINGKIKIYDTYADTLKAGLAPEGLNAKDD